MYTQEETMTQWFHLVGQLYASAIALSTHLRLLMFWIHERRCKMV